MKTQFSFMVAIVLCLTVLSDCKKDESLILLPTVKVLTIKDITATTATIGGEVVSDGGAVVTVRGVCWSSSSIYPCTSDSRTKNGSGLGIFTISISGLEPGTTYFVRSYAVNAIGTAYCSMTEFKTLTETESSNETVSPFIRTSAYSYLTDTSFYCGGNIQDDGGAGWTESGICWSTSQAPTISNLKTANDQGSRIFTCCIPGLTPGTTYYARAYVTNSTGTSYGNEIMVTTLKTIPPGPPGDILFNPDLTYGSLSDIDGNTYKTIRIGTQTWMAENLRTTKYKDGTEILYVTVKDTWDNLNSPGYCWYDNKPEIYKKTYGALYNWFTVKTAKLCPVGWHVPDDAEWNILETYLGGENVAGGKLKETGFTHWQSPNTGAGNESGFSALPGGIHSTGWPDAFGEIGSSCYFWSSDELEMVIPDTNPVSKILTSSYRYLIFSTNQIFKNEEWWEADKRWGCSVRCLKD